MFTNHQRLEQATAMGVARLGGYAPMSTVPTARLGIKNRQSELKAG